MDQIEHPDELEIGRQSGELEEQVEEKRSDELFQSGEHPAITDLATQPLPEPDETSTIGAVVAGHICLDITPTLSGNAITIAPGKLIEAGKAVLATGGSVSNTGLALHRLGVTTRLMGKVGNDLFGQAMFQIIASFSSHLAAGMVIAPGEVSSYALIVKAPGAERLLIHSPGSNDTFNALDLNYELIERAQLFHFGNPSHMTRMYTAEGAELASSFRRVKEMGVTTSLDLSLPDLSSAASRANWQAILAATLPFVDVFLPSIEALLLLLRRPLYDKLASRAKRGSLLDYIEPDTFSELGKTLLDLGAKIVGVKAGRRGFYLRTAAHNVLEGMGHAQPPHLAFWTERELWAPCFATEVVDSTGSDDATAAGFLMGLLRGMTPDAALSAACAVGASSVESADALSGIRSWPRIMARIADGWPRLLPQDKKLPALDLAAAGWRWDEVREVWTGPNDLHRT